MHFSIIDTGDIHISLGKYMFSCRKAARPIQSPASNRLLFSIVSELLSRATRLRAPRLNSAQLSSAQLNAAHFASA